MNRISANKPYFPEPIRRIIADEIAEILAGGRLTQGPWVSRFEQAFAEYIGAKFAIATNSGTSALEILLRFYDVRGCEVIVPTNTFLASGNAVIFARGKPVLADISADTLCLDPEDLKRKITPKTKGVILVHIAGLITPQISEIRDLCRSRGLFLLEDAAHAPGAAIDQKFAGNLADGAAFSFYPTKPMTTGEGGMITTNDPVCAESAQSIRCHGIAIGAENTGENKNLLLRLGHNWRMSELQAVVGWHQLQTLDDAIAKRQTVAKWYANALANSPGLRLFEPPENVRHSFYKYPVLLDKPASLREVNRQLLEEFGVQSGSIYWPPCHLQPFYLQQFGYRRGDFPVAEAILERTIALPIYPELSRDSVNRVAAALCSILADPVPA